jgi:tetratricopeptide (TPR) repeat protein
MSAAVPDSGAGGGRRRLLLPWLTALVVIGIYGAIAGTAVSELGSRTAGEDYYNRLSDGFARGHASLDLAPPPWLTQLPDPYDAQANAPFQGQRYAPGRIHDLSYYQGKLYLYFSAIPAAVLFLPFHALTGAYLSHQQACFIFCSVGFLAAAALADSIRRHCFPAAGPAMAALGTLAIGLVPVTPIVLERADVWEVPITAAYAFWMLALLLIWSDLRRPRRSWTILLGASAAVGLAIGCRPNGAFGASLLLVPLFRPTWRPAGPADTSRWTAGVALALPIAVIGAGLLAYNHARFGHVLEFGQSYQIAGGEERAVRRFDPSFFWYDFRLYFLEYPGWRRSFPFVRDPSPPSMPVGHNAGDNPVGALTLLPFLLCAAALPLGLSRRRHGPDALLAPAVGAVALVFAALAVPLCLFISACVRYQLEFLPALTLLAVLGFYSLTTDAAPGSFICRGLRLVAGLAAAASIAFTLLAALSHRAEAHTVHGMIVMQSGRTEEAAGWYRRALRLQPGAITARLGLAEVRLREQRYAEAAAEFVRVEKLDPDSPTMHLHYAYCLLRLARPAAAEEECAWALRLRPDYPDAREFARTIALLRSPGPVGPAGP